MTKALQTNDELMIHLRDSLGFLDASSTYFDAGYVGEATRLATTIRVLVHDTAKSKSLLGLLDFKTKINYISTVQPFDPNNLMYQHDLVATQLNSEGASHVALLDNIPGELLARTNYSRTGGKR